MKSFELVLREIVKSEVNGIFLFNRRKSETM